MDCLRLSNRFAGPMVRLRVAMQGLANGEPVKPVKLRDGDFWCEFAADFNRVLAREADRTDAAASSAEDTRDSGVSAPCSVLSSDLPRPTTLTADSHLPV